MAVAAFLLLPGSQRVFVFQASLVKVNPPMSKTCSGATKTPEITPYSKSKLTHLPQFGGRHAEDLYWSTYRPGQYFGMLLVLNLTHSDTLAPTSLSGITITHLMPPGMRTRSPKSLLAGLMWFDPQRPDALNNIRHNAQERDGMHFLPIPMSLLSIEHR